MTAALPATGDRTRGSLARAIESVLAAIALELATDRASMPSQDDRDP